MFSSYIYLLIISSFSITASLDFTLRDDPCFKYDSCFSKSVVQTCSCDKSCQLYGTCCYDVQKGAPGDTFKCYHHRTSTPVFAKRSCSDDFKGHVGEIDGCLDDEVDEMDVKNNLLVTSHKTKITYWNKNCAKCNNEAADDLEFWNIEVFCPQHKDVSRDLIRRNLTFNQDLRQWGLQMDEQFLQCVVKYAPPPYIEEVNHCTPNLISSCPEDYGSKQVTAKCAHYYAERKLKHSERRFRNIHCAMCNGVDVKELECPGTLMPEESADEADFKEMIEEVFIGGYWLRKSQGRYVECGKGFTYDPFQGRCRKDLSLDIVTVAADFNGSQTFQTCYLLLLACLFVFKLL